MVRFVIVIVGPKPIRSAPTAAGSENHPPRIIDNGGLRRHTEKLMSIGRLEQLQKEHRQK